MECVVYHLAFNYRKYIVKQSHFSSLCQTLYQQIPFCLAPLPLNLERISRIFHLVYECVCVCVYV